MSEMSKASAPSGGDPLEVMPDTGAKDDVLPGPPADVDPTDDRSGGTSDVRTETADPEPHPASRSIPPPSESDGRSGGGRDPLDAADTEGARTPGVGGSESSSDPMPDMAGTSDGDPTDPIS